MDFTKYQTNISCIFFSNDKFESLSLKLKIYFNSEATTPEQGMMSQVAYKKINEWISINLSDIIVCSIDSANEIMFCDNSIMTTHKEPNEIILAKVLLAKFRTLAGNHLNVLYIELYNENNGMTHSISESLDLPSISYLGSKETYFDTPWWNRNDNTTMDYDTTEWTDELREFMNEEVANDYIKLLEQELTEQYLPSEEEPEVIEFEKLRKWKPKEV